jgi:hypothetical protein
MCAHHDPTPSLSLSIPTSMCMSSPQSIDPSTIHHHLQAAAKISATSAWALSTVVKFNMVTEKASCRCRWTDCFIDWRDKEGTGVGWFCPSSHHPLIQQPKQNSNTGRGDRRGRHQEAEVRGGSGDGAGLAAPGGFEGGPDEALPQVLPRLCAGACCVRVRFWLPFG